MKEVEFILKTARSDKFCSRCESLGIDDPTILKGNAYYLVTSKDFRVNCCYDCFTRMDDEIKELL